MEYHFSKITDLKFNEAITKAIDELRKEGFGVMTEIDVKAALKMKLNEDFRPYWILGACNPGFAHRALTVEDKIGTLMPCNVVVQEHADGRVEVSAMNPAMLASMVDDAALGELSREVSQAMQRVLGAI